MNSGFAFIILLFLVELFNLRAFAQLPIENPRTEQPTRAAIQKVAQELSFAAEDRKKEIYAQLMNLHASRAVFLQTLAHATSSVERELLKLFIVRQGATPPVSDEHRYALLFLGRALLDTGNPSEAIPPLEKFGKTKHIQRHYALVGTIWLGEALWQIGQHSQAERRWQSALPSLNPELRAELATTYLRVHHTIDTTNADAVSSSPTAKNSYIGNALRLAVEREDVSLSRRLRDALCLTCPAHVTDVGRDNALQFYDGSSLLAAAQSEWLLMHDCMSRFQELPLVQAREVGILQRNRLLYAFWTHRSVPNTSTLMHESDLASLPVLAGLLLRLGELDKVEKIIRTIEGTDNADLLSELGAFLAVDATDDMQQRALGFVRRAKDLAEQRKKKGRLLSQSYAINVAFTSLQAGRFEDADNVLAGSYRHAGSASFEDNNPLIIPMMVLSTMERGSFHRIPEFLTMLASLRAVHEEAEPLHETLSSLSSLLQSKGSGGNISIQSPSR